MSNDSFLKEAYGLRANPFLDKAAREIHLGFWIDREEQLKIWKQIIEKASTSDKNYIVFIVGNYGRGKTLSLLKVLYEAEQHMSVFPIYINFKSEEKTKSGLDFIFQIFKGFDFKKLAKGRTKEQLQAAVENIPKDLEEPRTVLKQILLEEHNKIALYFVRGEVRPTSKQIEKLGVIRKIESVDVAKEYLAALLCVIRGLGYRTLMLIVDEFEYLFSLVPRSQHSIYLALLRGLYDFPLGLGKETGEIVNMAFFVAISEDGRANLNEIVAREKKVGGPTIPLLDRVDAETVLGTLGKDETRQLIEKRLRFNRVRGRFQDKPLIPFTDDFVEYIHNETGGEPRAIITRCSQVLDAGLEERAPMLDREFATRVLKSRGF